MKSGVEIRGFVFPDDYPAVYGLWADAGPGLHLGRSDTPEEVAKKMQRDPDLFLVAESGGHLVGAVMGGFDGRRGIVYHLAVAAAYRHTGIGRGLMDALEDRLRGKGCLRAYLLITMDNDAAQFYSGNGWQPMDLLIYGKDLS
jgi:ribosomal protein S18 acetylase RimI-like enzyme